MNNQFPVLPTFATAHVDAARYAEMYTLSITDPEVFWGDIAREFLWHKPWHHVKNAHFTGDVSIRWFEGAQLNITENCIDRWAETTPDKTAILWEGDTPGQVRHISYRELLAEVCRVANALQSLGVKRGDRVTIYLPMVPEAAFAMLAVARLGAVHSVVFAGFSPDAIAGRVGDCASEFIITANYGRRGGKTIPLKANIDAAIEGLGVRHVLVLDIHHAAGAPLPAGEATRLNERSEFSRSGEGGYPLGAALPHPDLQPIAPLPTSPRSRGEDKEGGDWANPTSPAGRGKAPRDIWWHDIVPQQLGSFTPAVMEAEDPLFILYTSGSTGAPKGVVHTTAGYMVYAATTTKYVFDLQPDDVYWCTADVGWITGHSYILYGPLANGATTLMFEGVPNYPDASRFWQVVDAHKVTKFYTAPTAIRALMALGDGPVNATSRASLKLLASVGEPINPEAWLWYYRVVGGERCPVIDTWWQTETGGHMLTALPGVNTLKPGSCSRPFFGVVPEIYDAQGVLQHGAAEGMLCIAESWPGQARSIWGDHARFIQTYFSTVPGKYFTSDGCRRDADGDFWITGRVDDVINVSGHRLGTAEIESALVAHPHVAEAAVVGYPHPIKGQGVYAYVTLTAEASAKLVPPPVGGRLGGGLHEQDLPDSPPPQPSPSGGGSSGAEALMAELKQHVRKHIGGLAVPDFVHLTPGLPKTRSGKIMRRILRKIAENEIESLGDVSTLLDPEIVAVLIANRLTRPH
ncbi:MAG: acetate--CoA ligase [Rickettsiales bacterium]